jgi:hypothetical protein
MRTAGLWCAPLSVGASLQTGCARTTGGALLADRCCSTGPRSAARARSSRSRARQGATRRDAVSSRTRDSSRASTARPPGPARSRDSSGSGFGNHDWREVGQNVASTIVGAIPTRGGFEVEACAIAYGRYVRGTQRRIRRRPKVGVEAARVDDREPRLALNGSIRGFAGKAVSRGAADASSGAAITRRTIVVAPTVLNQADVYLGITEAGHPRGRHEKDEEHSSGIRQTAGEDGNGQHQKAPVTEAPAMPAPNVGIKATSCAEAEPRFEPRKQRIAPVAMPAAPTP